MKKRKGKIIQDPKLRGEWVESVFMARVGELGLPVSKPWGDSKTFDFVVGSPGKFVSVQVKSTIAEASGGYVCTVKRNNQKYARGSFDFMVAYVIPEDVWYVVPAEKFAGRATLVLSSNSSEAKYEAYREAWYLLREATGSAECESRAGEAVKEVAEAATPQSGPPRFPRNALERVEAAMNFARRSMEGREPTRRTGDEE
jgi:hypothetical protein